MALIVEDGTGKSDADTYISEGDADTYVASFVGTHTQWDAGDSAAKELWLRQGAQYVDSQSFAGFPTKRDQKLAWPRTSVNTEGARTIQPTTIPTEIPDAQVEAALIAAEGTDLFPNVARGGRLISESNEVGPIKESKTYSEGASPFTTFSAITSKLRKYLSIGTVLPG